MTYHVEVELGAAKALERVARGDPSSAQRIKVAIRGLSGEPRPANATKLVGVDAWRVRVGTYRVVYTIEDAIRIVTINRIGHGRDVYER